VLYNKDGKKSRLQQQDFVVGLVLPSPYLVGFKRSRSSYPLRPGSVPPWVTEEIFLLDRLE
jgi:hypothetical protein